MTTELSNPNEVESFQFLSSDQTILKYFWALASQLKANSLGDVLHTLIDRNNLTVRNVMTYRYLGLLKKSGEKIVRTSAGEALVSAFPEEQQRILDMQIAKIWLQNPTNPRLKIDVYPFEVLIRVLLEIQEISWQEYLAIVMWVQDESEITKAVQLIEDFRALTPTQRDQVIVDTELRSGSQDLENQARRLHRALAAHSLLARNGDNSLTLTVTDEKAVNYLELFQQARSIGHGDYATFLEEESEFAPGEVDLEPKNVVLVYKEVLLEAATKSAPKVPAGGRKPRKIDYVAKAQNQAISGLRAEAYVLESEKAYLNSIGRVDLSERVSQVSLVDDSAGYDVLSFSEDGSEKHIEVKSVGAGQGNCSIFISKNEIAKAISDPQWELVLVVGNGTTKPYLWNAVALSQAIFDANFSAPLLSDDLQITATQFQIAFRIASVPEED
ncbi:MAG: hypothetical protein RLZZ56_850 [Actinomycetota bacterium]